jgi:hypothetical protein
LRAVHEQSHYQDLTTVRYNPAEEACDGLATQDHGCPGLLGHGVAEMLHANLDYS